MQIIPVILAGGMGERLWPLSSADEPKQFALRDAAGRSLFQATLLRIADRQQFAAPLIIANHAHRFLLLDQLRAIGCEDAQIILEPDPTGQPAADAIGHFGGTGLGKGQAQYAFGSRTAEQQFEHAGGEHLGLAGAGAGRQSGMDLRVRRGGLIGLQRVKGVEAGHW